LGIVTTQHLILRLLQAQDKALRRNIQLMRWKLAQDLDSKNNVQPLGFAAWGLCIFYVE
jgi:hypothetical protein